MEKLELATELTEKNKLSVVSVSVAKLTHEN
jgi:hypothetical protein